MKKKTRNLDSIIAAINSLPDKDREILVSMIAENDMGWLTYEEAAAILKLSAGQVCRYAKRLLVTNNATGKSVRVSLSSVRLLKKYRKDPDYRPWIARRGWLQRKQSEEDAQYH